MVIHIIFFGVCLLTNVKSRLKKRAALFFAFVALAVFCGLRYNYGNDYASYQRHFETIKRGITVFDEEYGFEFLNLVSPSFYVMVAVISTVFLITVYQLIVHCVDEKYYGIALIIWLINPYLFLMSLSAMRQTIATIFFIGAVYFSYKRKLIPYIVLILCAALFHKSAILLLPIYLIANKHKVGKVTIIAYVLLVFVMFWDVNFFREVMEYGLRLIDDKNYSYYYSTDKTGNSLRATMLTGIYFIYILLNLHKLDGWTLMSAKIYLVGVTMAILAFHTSMLTRIQMYMDIFSLVAIPGIMKVNCENAPTDNKAVTKVSCLLNRYLLPALVFIVYGLRYYSFFSNPRWESFTTYQTILELL